MMSAWRLLLILGLCGFLTLHAQEKPTLEKVKLGQREVTLLKTLDKLAKNNRDTVFVLALTPFVQLLESPDPLNWLFTISTNDWDKILDAAHAMNRITACASEAEFASFYADYFGKKVPNRAFWDEMRRLHTDRCK